MSIEKTSAHQFPQQLKLSSSNSHLISIPPPVKPVHYGNCDLFKGIYQDASIRVVLASKCPRVIGEVAQLETVQRILRFASGLAYLYTNSIIHGNLKAVDILLETSFSL
ncbi:hypothetical protein FRB94_014318 [Tulasnella sp. JGI-2019a]|nr:hypothetical protein FRB94_014318 [Tulasnella sp. JGI-2019a]